MAEEIYEIDQLPDISPETQQFFQDIADHVIPILENGRPFDLKHTFATVYWAYQLCVNEELDPEILIPAALFHDTGYYKLFSDDASKDFDKIQDMKELHMERSAELAEKFITTHPYFSSVSPEKFNKILFIIRNHDKIKDPELIKSDRYLTALVAADTFGQIDLERVDLTFDREQMPKYIKQLLEFRQPLITTEFGKKKFIDLFGKLYEHYVSM